MLIYRETVYGGLVAEFSLTYVLSVYWTLFWTLVCCDLFRITYFLRRKYRLNNAVLKPIAEMTEAAAALSANNLSNRINIAGTKNELKDLATVINGMLDRIERSYNSKSSSSATQATSCARPSRLFRATQHAGALGQNDKAVLDEGIAALSQETASMKELVERLLFLARTIKKP